MTIGTQKVQLYEIPGKNIYLADSPGFGDTYRDDASILADLDEALAELFCEKDVKTVGVLFLHSLTDAKMKGGAMRNLILLDKLVGTNNLQRCRLVTTKQSLALARHPDIIEKELRDNKDFWKPLLDNGANMVRFEDSTDSALKIIKPLVGRSKVVLRVTDETQRQMRVLGDTAAGREVNQEIIRAKEEAQKVIHQCKEHYRQAMSRMDKQSAEMFKEGERNAERRWKKLDLEKKKLRTRAESSSWRKWRWTGRICAAVAAGSIIMATDGLLTPIATTMYAAAENSIQKWR